MSVPSSYFQSYPYMSLFDYGNSAPSSDLGDIAYYQPGSQGWPGMTQASPSYGQPMGGTNSMTYTPPALAADKPGWKGMSGMEKMSAISQGVSAFATLANLYTGFKSLQMQKDQFKFAKSSWNKNFAAQLGAFDTAARGNYRKYADGQKFFGNKDYVSEDEWMRKYGTNSFKLP